MRLAATLLGLCAFAFALIASEDPPEAHVKIMKEVQELQGKIRKNVEVEASAKRVAELGKDIEAFWAKRSETGAKSSKDLIAAATALAKAAGANDEAAIKDSGKLLGGTCRSCHDAHRERVGENVYKIK